MQGFCVFISVYSLLVVNRLIGYNFLKNLPSAKGAKSIMLYCEVFYKYGILFSRETGKENK